MKPEDKELLLRDLCARLPYGVRCSFGVDDAVYEITGINPTCCGASEIQATHIKSSINGDFSLASCKPYLLPLSSMTEEEEDEYRAINCYEGLFPRNEDALDFVLSHHLDFRYLIPKGLAKDATNLNIY